MAKEQFTIRLPSPTTGLIHDFMAKHEISLSMALVMIVAQWNELVNKPAEKTVEKPAKAEKPFDNNIRWKGESDLEYTERLAVQRGRADTSDKMARGRARVLDRYNARGMPAIIFDDE